MPQAMTNSHHNNECMPCVISMHDKKQYRKEPEPIGYSLKKYVAIMDMMYYAYIAIFFMCATVSKVEE